MNLQQGALEFAYQFLLIQGVMQPTLTSLITFDHTAYETAKQIFNQNLYDISQQSPELRNKSQQLMSVLNYDSKPNEYKPTLAYTYRTNAMHKNIQFKQNQIQQTKLISTRQNQSKSRQPKHIQIKVRKNTEIRVKKQKSSSIIEKLNESNKTSNAYQKNISSDKYRNENINESNFEKNKIYKKQIGHSRHSSNRQEFNKKQFHDEQYWRGSEVKIVQLNKLQYKRSVPAWEAYRKQKQSQRNQYEKNNNLIQFQIKNGITNGITNRQGNNNNMKNNYQKNKNNDSLQRNHHIKNQKCELKINQFRLKSPQTINQSSYTQQFQIYQQIQNKVIKGRNSCSRIEKPYSKQNKMKLKTQGNTQKISKQIQTVWYQQQASQTSDAIMIDLSKKSANNQTLINSNNSIKAAPKVIKESKIILKKQLDSIDQDGSEMLTSRQKAAQQQKKVKQLLNFRQKQRQKQKRREQDLFAKLKQQFSQICFKEPNEDEKRVNQQIRQLQLKLEEMVTQKDKTNRVYEDYSPKAKVVKLDLSPTRSNIHKNMQYNSRVQCHTPKSPISHNNKSTSRLLSKKIEQAMKAN